MTNEHLNGLFESARNVPLETSPEEIATWAGIAATSSTGVLGLAGKLKLFIAKKTFVIMGTTLSIISLGVITAISMGSETPDKPEKRQYANQVIAANEEPIKEVVEVAPTDTHTKPIVSAPRATVDVKPLTPLAPKAVASEPPVLAVAPAAIPAMKPVPVSAVPCVSSCATTCATAYTTDRKRKKVKLSGNVVKKEYEISEFSKVFFSGVLDVVLIQGDKPGVVFETDENLQEFFVAENKGQVLNIDFSVGDGKAKNKNNSTVYVTITDLKELTFCGVGNLETKGKIELESLECRISGVGDLNFDMKCDDLDVNFSGVGDITLSGSGNTANYHWSGVGDLMAKDLVSKDVSLKLSGVGDADVNASEKLEVKLTGMGDVEYYGSPESTNLNTTGMGDIQGG